MKKLLTIRRVMGDSMLPALKAGDMVLAMPLKIRVGDLVVARQGGREVVKRVKSIDSSQYFLVGDNSVVSTDSRKHGPVKTINIIGRVVAKLPAATPPIKPKGLMAKVLNYGLAAIILCLIVLQLGALNQYILDLNSVLPGGVVAASWLAVLILLTEIFALPYLLLMRLSPLGHVVSGYLTVLVPLEWTLITIGAYGSTGFIGIIGSAAELKSSVGLLASLLVWLLLSYVLLWLRGYQQTFSRYNVNPRY